MTATTAKLAALKDDAPRTMAEALETDDPYEALMDLSSASAQRAQNLAEELTIQLSNFVLEIPEILIKAAKEESMHNPVTDATASADSILNSLTKIASGGSQASLEIRKLEEEKAEMEQHSLDVETALWLRKSCDSATTAIPSRQYDVAANAIQQFIQVKQWNRINNRAKAYAGEYTLQQLEQHQVALKRMLLEQYEVAVQQSDLQRLSQMTPLLPKVQLEQEAVSLYLKYLQSITAQEFTKALQTAPVPKGATAAPPYVLMARVYNAAVTILRHHLPMVSHCLHKAKGDAAVAQLVHVQVEQHVLPLFQKYIETRELPLVSQSAQRIYDMLEDRYSGRGLSADDDGDESDCGFASEVGTLADVDAAMEEAALCLQHAESYTRFMAHSVQEINKARELRFYKEQEDKRMERERQEWATGMSNSSVRTEDSTEQAEYKPLEILPPRTQLQEVVAEVGGYYSGIERCLLLASMQRAFVQPDTDPRYCSPLGMKGHSSHVASRAFQTSVVEACFFSVRRSTQRAFCTGHTGTSSAMANFASDALGGVLMTVMSQRVEEVGVHRLKPGEGLLVGSAGLFFQNIRHAGTQAGGVKAHHPTPKQKLEEENKRREMQMEIAKACATFNDLEVAMYHTRQLETLLSDAIDKGYPPGAHDTEQLRMCVKSFTPVSEGFKLASNSAVESLVTVLKPRIRSIVGEVVGPEGGATSGTFMGSMGGGKGGDRVIVKMNYDLDDDSYQMLQLSEGYMGRLCTLTDELISPLQMYLAPRLWDSLLLGVVEFTCKRLETSLRKCHFTALGAICLDSDMRDLLGFAKDRLDSPDLKSNVALYKACVPLARLMQISRLVNVDDLDDVLDLISSSKRKGNWDLKLDEAKAFLGLRREFAGDKVNELLRMDDD